MGRFRMDGRYPFRLAVAGAGDGYTVEWQRWMDGSVIGMECALSS